MDNAATQTSHFFVQNLPAGDTVTEWVHLLHAGAFSAVDGRGPFTVGDAQAIIAASFASHDRLVVDVNHSTQMTGSAGFEAPAYGWITELQARPDGIWAKVDWNENGREALSDRRYRGMSAVVSHTEEGDVLSIEGASLTNNPAIPGLKSNFTKQKDDDMSLAATLAQVLGLTEGAGDEEIVSAFTAKIEAKPDPKEGEALTALGALFSVNPTATAVLEAATSKLGQDKTVTTSLQAQVTTLEAKVTSLEGDAATKAAETFVDAEIAKGRMGLNAENRSEFVAMHKENPERAEKIISGFAIMPGSTGTGEKPPQGSGSDDQADPHAIAEKATTYFTAQTEAGRTITYADAVLHVSKEAAK